MSPQHFVVVLILGLLPLVPLGSPLQAAPSSPESVPDTVHAPLQPLSETAARGVVWTPPASAEQGRRALTRMAETGVTAVRLTRPPASDAVLSRADSLGLRLFVDLPVSHVAAGPLRDSLRAARPALDRLRRLALHHPSLHAVGLAQYADTSVPTACAPLQTWTDRLHNATPSLRTYYVTPFSAAQDQCGDTVDRPLLDMRDRDAPVSRWADWTADGSPAGIGALGTWVHASAAAGLRVPHSPERQARHLEAALTELLTEPASPPPIFVYRWQDATAHPLPFRRYGLQTDSGTPRPAAEVLAGFYTDTQHVFAFPMGTAPFASPIWVLLLGWGLIALLGAFYAQNLYVRQTLFRYFGAHGFYRDAIRRGREVGFTENILLLLGIGTALGIIGTITARIAASQPATALIVEALPPALRSPLATGLTHPLLAGLVIGIGSLALLLGWGILLFLTAERLDSFSFGQGLMLITWPCWPAVLGMLVALVAASKPPLSTGLLGLALLIGGGGSVLAITGRVLRNYGLVTNVPLSGLLLLALPSPPGILLLTFGVLVTQYDVPLSLLWHLAART